MCCAAPPGSTPWTVQPIIRLESRPGELFKERKWAKRKSATVPYSWLTGGSDCALQDGKHSWLCLWQPGIQVCCQRWAETREEKTQNGTVAANVKDNNVHLIRWLFSDCYQISWLSSWQYRKERMDQININHEEWTLLSEDADRNMRVTHYFSCGDLFFFMNLIKNNQNHTNT